MGLFFVGFDGYIDTLYQPVQRRLNQKNYTPYSTLSDFGAFIQSSAHRSCNVEAVQLASSLGGNAPLVTLGLQALLHPVQLIGCLGYPSIHPLFEPIRSSSISVGEAGTTSAYEFEDGKLMIGNMRDVLSLTIDELFIRCPDLLQHIKSSSFLVTVNWTMCPLVQEFWKWLITLPQNMLSGKSIFVDFSDPRKRPLNDFQEALTLLSQLSQRMPCYCSFNHSEASFALQSLGILQESDLETMATQLATRLPTLTLYLHSAEKIVGITPEKQKHTLVVQKTTTPLRLTGAGDMFNAGILSALSEQLSLDQQLKRGLQTSSHWVKTGTPATQSNIEK